MRTKMTLQQHTAYGLMTRTGDPPHFHGAARCLADAVELGDLSNGSIGKGPFFLRPLLGGRGT